MTWPSHPEKHSSGKQKKRHDSKPSSNAMMWETNEKKRKLTFAKMLWPNHPAKESSGTNMKTHASKHVS